MLTIDGSLGEGGGQILRTALALSLVTGTPFRIERVRAGRDKPGLLRQHLTSLSAAAAVGAAEVSGASVGSGEVTFRPKAVVAGEHRFAVGTAGSATLVLQTVLPALLASSAPSFLVLEGGTHNPHAPPFDFIERVFLPALARMGASVAATLDRPGFYPAGGGRFSVRVEGETSLRPMEWLSRGALVRRRATARVASLPRNVADRELKTLSAMLGLTRPELSCEVLAGDLGPGNVVLVDVESEHVTEIFSGVGERGIAAEDVARGVALDVQRYVESGAVAGPNLADQLLLPMALAGGGAFRTGPPTLHTETQRIMIERFLPVRISLRPDGDGTFVAEVARAP